MAKFFITNNDSFYKRIIETINKSPFNIGFTYHSEKQFAVSVKKLFVDNTNGWVKDNGMVITIGTPIYKESLNNACIIDDFDGDIEHLRKNLIGQYAVVVKRANKTSIFCDGAGAFNVFYYYDGKDYLVSNDIKNMAIILGDKVEPSEINLLEEVCQNSILCGDSLYEGINRLKGYESIEIYDDVEFSVEKHKISYYLTRLSYDECVNQLIEKFRYKASVIHKVFGNPDIFMTGGLDARISLASYLSIGSKPHLHYGIGNSFITNTIKKDLEIAKEFSSRYDLKLTEENWSTPTPFYKYWDKYINQYGVLAKNYASSDSIIHSFENLPNLISTFGYGGELYRNLPWMENRKKPFFTVDEFVDEYYIGGTQSWQMTNKIPGYRERILSKVRKICEIYGLDPNHINNEDNRHLLLEYRCYADTYILNMMNMMRYSNLLLFEKDCIDLTNISVKDMRGSKLMLDVINGLYSDVLDVPIFSHCKIRKYNKMKGCLDTEKKSIYTRVAKHVPYFIKHFIKVNILKRREAKVDYSCLESSCLSELITYPGFVVSEDLDKRYLVSYALLNNILNLKK